MTSELATAAAITQALRLQSTADSTAAVKEAVARSLQAIDATVTIETTDFFNHSFAPDLVLSWKKTAAPAERFVYLRFNDDPTWITEELPQLEGR